MPYLMHTRTIILTLLFFLTVQCMILFHYLPGLVSIGLLFLLLGILAFLAISSIVSIIRLFSRKFDKGRLVSLLVRLVVIGLVVLFPAGIYPYDPFEGPDLMLATWKDGPSCTVSIKLKEDNRFRESSLCGPPETYRGNYRISGDTIHLDFDYKNSSDSKKAFAVLQPSLENAEKLIYYQSPQDSVPLEMEVSLFEAEKLQLKP